MNLADISPLLMHDYLTDAQKRWTATYNHALTVEAEIQQYREGLRDWAHGDLIHMSWIGVHNHEVTSHNFVVTPSTGKEAAAAALVAIDAALEELAAGKMPGDQWLKKIFPVCDVATP